MWLTGKMYQLKKREKIMQIKKSLKKIKEGKMAKVTWEIFEMSFTLAKLSDV